MATASNKALNRPRGPALIPPKTPPGTTTQPPTHATFCAPLFIDGWVNMEDNDYSRDVRREEVREIMENADFLIDLQSTDGDDDGDEEDKEPAPKMPASPDRLEEIAGLLKDFSIEIDGFEGEFGDLAQELNDASNKVQSRKRLHKAKTLEKKVAGNQFRQPNVQAFLVRKETTSDTTANGMADEPEPYRRHENAYWLLEQCENAVKGDPSETALELAEAALNAIDSIRKVEGQEDDDNIEEASSFFFNAFDHLRSRNIDLIMSLTTNSGRLVSDESLNQDVLKMTWEHYFN